MQEGARQISVHNVNSECEKENNCIIADLEKEYDKINGHELWNDMCKHGGKGWLLIVIKVYEGRKVCMKIKHA